MMTSGWAIRYSCTRRSNSSFGTSAARFPIWRSRRNPGSKASHTATAPSKESGRTNQTIKRRSQRLRVIRLPLSFHPMLMRGALRDRSRLGPIAPFAAFLPQIRDDVLSAPPLLSLLDHCSFLHLLVGSVCHGAHTPALHGTNLLNRNRHVNFSCLFEIQGQRKGLPLLERLFQSDHHDVQASRTEGDPRSGRDVNGAHLTHARHAVFFGSAMELDLVGYRRCRAQQAVTGAAVVDQGHIHNAASGASRRCTRPWTLNDDRILSGRLRVH